LKNGSLTLIGISNDLTFKERLDPRVISSLGEEEVVFTNYTVDQIHKILEDRIQSAFIEGAVEEPALNLCAAMAGREHGDARRAIGLLRVAGEIAEREQKEKITEEHIRMAYLKMEEDKETAALESYPLHEKLIILAVMKAGGSSTGEIFTAYKDLCKIVRQKELTQRRVTQMLSEIELSGIISGRIVHQGIHGRTKKFKLTISPETVKETFKKDLTLEDIV
jgi:cell division control protein 6